MPYTYTNRHGKVHYFREVETKKGKSRYYVTTSKDYPNLIEDVPSGYEVAELPEEARVVIRMRKPVWTTQEEKEIVHDAIKEFSAIKDFFVYATEEYLYVYHSQFNYVTGQDENLDREEAIQYYGEAIEKWMRFFTALRFKLIDKEKRLFQTERVVYLSLFGNEFFPVGLPGAIEDVAREYGQHLGKASFFDIEPNL